MISSLRWFVFAVAALAMNFPTLVTLVTSFKSVRELSTNPGLWVRAPTLQNYVAVFNVSDRLNIFKYLANSAAAAALGALLAAALALPAAYSIARGNTGERTLLPTHCQPARSSAHHLRHSALHDVPMAGAA